MKYTVRKILFSAHLQGKGKSRRDWLSPDEGWIHQGVALLLLIGIGPISLTSQLGMIVRRLVPF